MVCHRIIGRCSGGVTAVWGPLRGVWSLAIAALSAKMHAVALMTVLIHCAVAAGPAPTPATAVAAARLPPLLAALPLYAMHDSAGKSSSSWLAGASTSLLLLLLCEAGSDGRACA
eukprot:COSAG01_NODE_8966_length_2600_cov_4.632947_2_plen_115_part_00